MNILKIVQSKSKYKNNIIYATEGTFRSQKEYDNFILFKNFFGRNIENKVESITISDGYSVGTAKIRSVTYVPDYKITFNNTVYIIDSKGVRTDVYKIKKKILGGLGIYILEVKRSKKSVMELIALIREGKTPKEIFELQNK